MKLDERDEQKRKAAKLWLLKKWAILLLMALGMLLIAFLIDTFLVNRVISPLGQLAIINDNIKYYEDLSYTNAGYMDTTPFNEKITEYTQIRENEFYNSDDRIVATITRWPYFIKGGVLAFSFVLLGALVAFPLVFLFVTCRYAYKRYKLRINKKTRRLRSGNYTAQNK